MKITVYPTKRQGKGAFDGGKITEIKPIDFPHGTSEANRIGPLFYWAWASSTGDGVIGLHPHKGFEIVSYVLTGEIGHADTLGTESRVSAGGAQVMQTGSGVSHQEEIYGQHTEFFQIWFEPDLEEALRRQPTYTEHHDSDFTVVVENGWRRKIVIGDEAPLSLVADVQMDDLTVAAESGYSRELKVGRCLATVVIEGSGYWQVGTEVTAIQKPDFSILEGDEGEQITALAGRKGLRMAAIEVPLHVDYKLYGS